MKHKKQIIMIILIAFLLVGLTTLAAADNNKTDTAQPTKITKTTPTNKDTTNINKVPTTKKDTKNMTTQTTKDPTTTKEKEKTINKATQEKTTKTTPTIEVKNYTALVKAVEEAKTSTTEEVYQINLLPEGDYTATQEIIWGNSQYTKTLIIEGNNITLNGNNNNIRFITIAEGYNVILNNITIQNYTYTSDELIISYYWGAIHNYGNLTITNAIIKNNHITLTSILSSSYGGAIHNEYGTLTINNTNLNNNRATTSGGAIYNEGGSLNINNSNLNYNNAGKDGGAIYNKRGNLTINNTNLNNNTANEGGGAISNDEGIIYITQSNLTHNKAKYYGGAIYNWGKVLTVFNSTLNNNDCGGYGGAIFNYKSWREVKLNVTFSFFTENHANGNGGAIGNEEDGITSLITNNTFTRNTASDYEETLVIKVGEKTIADNNYDSTDILLKTIYLSTQDLKTTYQYGEDINLKYTVELRNKDYYDEDILDKINKTLYIDAIENSTTKEKNYTLSQLKAGYHTIYYKTCNSQSDYLALTVTGDSKITTDKTAYDHVDGIKNRITLNITDPSGEKGTINITVKDQDEYKKLSSYSNVGNGYQLSTDALVETLENLYTDLSESYTINISYTSNNEYVNTSSTEFTLNIIKKRNTTIGYEIINNTEANVQINITVLDAIYKTPIPDAQIQITGALTNETTTGIITDNTLTPGEYNITVNFNETTDYNPSNTTITFTVEIDKDAKIAELENNITNLTQEIQNAQQEIQNLTETNTQLEQQINATLKTLEDLNNTLNNLTKQLENALKEIQDLNQTITELNKTMNTTINIKPVTSSVGSHVNLTATITDEAGNKVTTGKVLFKVNGITLKDANGNVIYAIVNNGEATLITKTQAAWIKNTTNVQAVYGGEKPYKSSRANTTNITITKGKATITLEEKTITAKAGQTITLKAKVLDSNGDRINNDKVVFKLNGRTLTDKDGKTLYARVVDGEAVLEYPIPETYNAKTYNLTAVFGGNYYERTQTQGTLILEKKATTITPENINTTDGKTTIKATIRDETGKTLITSTKVVIKINGKTITTTNSTNGTIDTSFTTTLKPGTYELTIISGENGQYKKATMTTALKI